MLRWSNLRFVACANNYNAHQWSMTLMLVCFVLCPFVCGNLWNKRRFDVDACRFCIEFKALDGTRWECFVCLRTILDNFWIPLGTIFWNHRNLTSCGILWSSWLPCCHWGPTVFRMNWIKELARRIILQNSVQVVPSCETYGSSILLLLICVFLFSCHVEEPGCPWTTNAPHVPPGITPECDCLFCLVSCCGRKPLNNVWSGAPTLSIVVEHWNSQNRSRNYLWTSWSVWEWSSSIIDFIWHNFLRSHAFAFICVFWCVLGLFFGVAIGWSQGIPKGSYSGSFCECSSAFSFWFWFWFSLAFFVVQSIFWFTMSKGARVLRIFLRTTRERHVEDLHAVCTTNSWHVRGGLHE